MADELDDLLAGAEPALAGYLAGKLRLAAPPGDGANPCRKLFTPEGFDNALAPLKARYPDTDRRAAVSLWSLYYFSTLSIAPVVLWRRLGIVLPLALDDVLLMASPDSGLPRAFVLSTAGKSQPGISTFDALGALIDGHLRPAIDFMSGHCRLSPRLLWCNAAGYLNWIVRELDPGNDEAESLSLFAPRCPDGSANPLHGLIRREAGTEGCAPLTRRKVCCLRYMVPGVGGCGETCPLPQGRE